METEQFKSQRKFSNKRLSFFLALVYVVLGNFFAWLSVPPVINETLEDIAYVIFFPCTASTGLILFAERNKFIPAKEKQLSLFLGISIINSGVNEPATYYNIIPVGQISFPD